MRKISIFLLSGLILAIAAILSSCNTRCVDEVLLQTIKMDLQVNSENLGISISAPKNAPDTIRSETHQFYNYPDFRRFGSRYCPNPSSILITSAYAADDCPEQTDYISRMDASKTQFSLDRAYDASNLGLGVLAAETDLMQIDAVKDAYLLDFINNIFLNGGAPAPLTLTKNFFQPLNGEWVSFYFVFEEIDGTEFLDSARAFIDISF